MLDMLERLVGVQAQEPQNPYVALWSRLDGFDPASLSDAIASRAAVRAGLMRATIHLVSARDLLAIQPVTLPVLAGVFRSQFARALRAPLDDVVAAGRELLSQRPRTRAELGELLATRWPQDDPAALGHAVVLNLPLVQIPPRGLWRQSGQATWALTTDWAGEAPGAPDAESLVLRYLAAFGPAAPADVRTWCRVTGLRDVIARLRPDLRTFRDEAGRELLDVPDGLFVDPATPAPPRLLPEFDNVALSHADRDRIFGDSAPMYESNMPYGSLLVDGFLGGRWRLEGETLRIERFRSPRDRGRTERAVRREAEALLAFLLPDAMAPRVLVAGDG